MKGLLYSKRLSRRSLLLDEMWNAYRVPSCDAKETLTFTTTGDAYFKLSKLCAQRMVPDEHYLPIATGCATMVYTVAHTIPAQFEHAVHKLAMKLLGR